MEAIMEKAVVVSKAVKVASVLLAKTKQRDLVRALQSVTGIVERRHSLTILSNVLIKKCGQSLELTSSDLELQLQTEAQLGAGESVAAVTVSARKIVDILKAMPDEQDVSLTLTGDKLVVTGGKSKFTVQTLPAADFPLVVEASDYGTPFSVSQKVLLSLIHQVQYAMAQNDIRFYLNGLLLETDGDTVRAVGTDGHRLALAVAKLPQAGDARSVILPRKAVLELARLLKDDDQSMVEIKLASTQASFAFNGMSFKTKLLDGKFPDYRRVIPANHTTKVTFERTMVVASLQRAELLSSEKFKGVELIFTRDTLEIRCTNGDEEVVEEIGIDYEGEELRIGFNVKYLIEGLHNVQGDTVSLSFLNAGASVLIGDPVNLEFRGVVMPMRI